MYRTNDEYDVLSIIYCTELVDAEPRSGTSRSKSKTEKKTVVDGKVTKHVPIRTMTTALRLNNNSIKNDVGMVAALDMVRGYGGAELIRRYWMYRRC